MRLNLTFAMTNQLWVVSLAAVFAVIFSVALFTSVALINIAVLGLILLTPFAWRDFLNKGQSISFDEKLFLSLVIVFCAWDLLTNLLAGFGPLASLKALLHDIRPLGFVTILWAIFANPKIARIAFWGVCLSVLFLASINLLMTLLGSVTQGRYFTTDFWGMSHLSHMYGQAIVGLIFVFIQMWLVRPHLSWRVVAPIILLLLSLFLASERRTGWLLFFLGFLVWVALNSKTIFSIKYKWWLLCVAGVLVAVATSSNVVHARMALALNEIHQFLSMSQSERSAALLGSTSIRLQYAITAWESIKQMNYWVGVGSIGFPQAYQAAAIDLGVSQKSWEAYNWSNPHNEYLYMLASKGVVGLALYLGIFVQACRVAWRKDDEVQRIGLVIFVFLFMASITANSMIIDMEEGHFAMFILLVFLAPKSLNLSGVKAQNNQFVKIL